MNRLWSGTYFIAITLRDIVEALVYLSEIHSCTRYCISSIASEPRDHVSMLHSRSLGSHVSAALFSGFLVPGVGTGLPFIRQHIPSVGVGFPYGNWSPLTKFIS